MRQEVDHCWGVVSGVTPGGVQLPFAVPHGLHLLITGLRTHNTSTAAEVVPVGSCYRSPVVVCHRTGLIGVRVFAVHAVCTDRVTGQQDKTTWRLEGTETYGNVLNLAPLTWSVPTTQGAPPMPRPAVATFRVPARRWLVYSICLIHISFSNSKIHTRSHTYRIYTYIIMYNKSMMDVYPNFGACALYEEVLPFRMECVL